MIHSSNISVYVEKERKKEKTQDTNKTVKEN